MSNSAPPQPPPKPNYKLVALALTASFATSATGQFIPTNIADLQGGLALTPDEASWVTTAYTMGSFAGIVLSGPLFKALGFRRFLASSSLIVAVTAVMCCLALPLQPMALLRFLQGAAAGGLGPVAFVAVFMTCRGPTLPVGLFGLAFALLYPGTLGPIMSSQAEAVLGWQALFAAQAIVASTICGLALALLPTSPLNTTALRTDWCSTLLLISALATLMLFLGQGTRRFWFESQLICWAAAICIGSCGAFVLFHLRSTSPIVTASTLRIRKFIVPIGLNLVFRASFTLPAYLVPLFMGTTQGLRPIELGNLMLWAALPQIFILPVVWLMLRKFDGRVVMALGLLTCAAGAYGFYGSTSVTGPSDLHLAVALFAIGQAIFLPPNLIVGATALKPADLPMGSLAFNVSTLGGTTLGTAALSHFVTEREKFHSNTLGEYVSMNNLHTFEKLAGISTNIASRFPDDEAALKVATNLIAQVVRREAWVLSFNDGFLVIAAVLAITAIGVAFIGKSPSLDSNTAK